MILWCSTFQVCYYALETAMPISVRSYCGLRVRYGI
jgi:hypothetical protein